MITAGAVAPRLDVMTVGGAQQCWPRSGAGALLVCFLRPLGGVLGRAALHELESLVDEGPLLAIVQGPAAHARAWVDGVGSRVPVVADADGQLAATWGMGRDPGWAWTLRGLSQGRVDARWVLGSRRFASDTRRWPSDLLPAEILIDDAGVVRWAHLACSRLEAPDVAGARKAVQEARLARG